MARKNDVNKINLKISDMEVYPPLTTKEGKFIHNGCMRLFWDADIGFGQYDVWLNENGEWCGDSENLDSQEDKDFAKKLLELVVEKLIITG